jgi:hypothetical protein
MPFAKIREILLLPPGSDGDVAPSDAKSLSSGAAASTSTDIVEAAMVSRFAGSCHLEYRKRRSAKNA